MPISMLQTVLDCVDVRALAEFYRQLLDLQYRPGDEPPTDGSAEDVDWLVIHRADGGGRLAFQRVDEPPNPTWPGGNRPQMLHLDLTVPTMDELAQADRRALDLGARLVYDRWDDPEEPLRVYADPAGHPFCIFLHTGG